MERKQLFAYIKKNYKAIPEYLWKRFPTYAVFRHSDNKKWFALVAGITKDKLGLPEDAVCEVINLKVDDRFYHDIITREAGIFPAYHMSKQNWVTVLLDGTVPDDRILDLLDASYLATASTKKKQKYRPPKEWIIPSNPKYYDIVHAFDDTEEILWKQGSGIKTGDTVFLYVGAPVSAILYQCKVTETDIPYQYADRNLTINALMRIRLVRKYNPDQFTFEKLKEEYGIYAVRGPRGIPNSLSEDLKRKEK